MATPNFGDLVTSTLQKALPDISDNITNHNPLLQRLKQKGMIEKTRGGRTILEPLIYGTNSSAQWYQDYDTFTPPTSGQQAIDAAEYQWKQIGGFFSWSGKEERINTGKEERYDLYKARKTQLVANLSNMVAQSIYSDGTASGGKELTGLKQLISDTPTSAGVVGGIDQVANPFWQNKATNIGAAVTATNVVTSLNAMWFSLIRNSDKPDMLVGDVNWYTAYLNNLQQLQRFTTDNARTQAGFPSLAYMEADFFYDSNCTTKHCYFVDTDAIHWRAIDDRALGFEVLPARQVPNADYQVVPVFAMANLTCGRRAGCGVLIST
jgi:hypothetical protein